MDLFQQSIALHKQLRGKLDYAGKIPVISPEDLSLLYNPGIAEPCRQITVDEDTVYDYTGKGNVVALISDGSEILDLGDLGPFAALPLLETKALLYKRLANINAVPLVLSTHDPIEIANTINLLSPGFGAICLEDIASSRRFAIEKKVKQELPIPLFNGSHGLAVTVLAGLINSHKLLGKDLTESKIVICSANGDAAVANLLSAYGAMRIEVVDHTELTNALNGADVYVEVSPNGSVTPEMASSMSRDPIAFTLIDSNKQSFKAISERAAIVGTGQANSPNPVSSMTASPGIIKGALSVRAREINETMLLAAAIALANSVSACQLRKDYVLPNPLAGKVSCLIAKSVATAAKHSGAA